MLLAHTGTDSDYKAMRVVCLVAAVDDDAQCPVATKVRAAHGQLDSS